MLGAVAEVLAVPNLVAASGQNPTKQQGSSTSATHLVIARRKHALHVVDAVVLGEHQLVGASPILRVRVDTVVGSPPQVVVDDPRSGRRNDVVAAAVAAAAAHGDERAEGRALLEVAAPVGVGLK